jgi:outer membrane usher protein
MQLSKRSEQVTLSLNLNEYGSIGAGYFDVRAGDGTRTRLINLSYSKPLWGSSSVYLSANREVGDSQWAVQAQLVIPFDLHGTLALGMERSKEGETLQRVNYSHAVPAGVGVGYNLGYAAGGDRGCLSPGRRDLAPAVGAVAGRAVWQPRADDPLG